MLPAVLVAAPMLCTAGNLEVPLRENELVLWSKPAQVDFWVPDDVVILDNPISQFLADIRGMVLYSFRCDEDLPSDTEDRSRSEAAGFTPQETCARVLRQLGHPTGVGQPRCVGGCAMLHPPLLARSGAHARGDFTLARRDDGTLQWAYKGHPLYRFAYDEIQGYPAGTQTGGVWQHMRVDGEFSQGYSGRRRVAPTPPSLQLAAPGVRVQVMPQGDVLADYRGMTLYTAADAALSTADQGQWKPLPAPALASQIGDWTVMLRADGFRLWAFKGRAVYTCDGDLKPGDVNCTGQGWASIAPEL